MSDAQLADLKQFIITTVSSAEVRIIGDVSQMIDVAVARSEARLESRLIARMDSGFTGVADAIENLQGQIDGINSKLNVAQ